ncbi:MAG: hypothetical protein Q7S03_00375 [bacterium]|nr:hypothetical protein [bacterium]
MGIDLGSKDKRSTGLCFLEKTSKGELKIETQTITGKNLIKTLTPYFPKIKVIAIDGPLSIGPGKGKMRLFEKFLSQKRFRQHQIRTLPPAVIPEIVNIGQELISKLDKRGFQINKNLLETSSSILKNVFKKESQRHFSSKDEEDAYYCAYLAYLHSQKQTFFMGYKDGKLFLPKPSLWQKDWWKLFRQAWVNRHPFKYKHLFLG